MQSSSDPPFPNLAQNDTAISSYSVSSDPLKIILLLLTQSVFSSIEPLLTVLHYNICASSRGSVRVKVSLVIRDIAKNIFRHKSVIISNFSCVSGGIFLRRSTRQNSFINPAPVGHDLIQLTINFSALKLRK